MKDFYKSNTFLAIISIVIAVIIWIYVAYEVNPMYETTIDEIPVKCINVSELFEDGSLVITGDNADVLKGNTSMSLTVKGKRSVISSITAKNFTCTLDMITVNQDGTFSLRPSVEHDISGLEIVKSSPYKFKIVAENMEQRDIDINVKTTGTLPQGYDIENVIVHNKQVKITGASSVVDRVKKAEISFNYDELTETDSEKTYAISFYDARGGKINPDSFKKTIEYVKIGFDLYTEKKVDVILMPKYADEISKNHYGNRVRLSISSSGDKTEDGGVKLSLILRGTANGLKKYVDTTRTVYTEDIDIANVYTDKVFENVKAAELSNDVSYVSLPKVTVKAKVER